MLLVFQKLQTMWNKMIQPQWLGKKQKGKLMDWIQTLPEGTFSQNNTKSIECKIICTY